MTEDNENMEVSDILSSIKSILEEDEENKDINPVNAANGDDEADAADAGEADGADDIIELSDDMRIDGTENDIVEINQVEEGSPLDLAIGDIDDENKAPELESLLSDVAENTSGDAVAEMQAEPIEGIAEDATDVVIEDKEEVVSTDNSDGDANIDENPTEPEQDEQENRQEDVEINNETEENSESEVINNEVMETKENEVDVSDDLQKEEEQKISDDITATEAKETEAGADDAVDVSASIISNFAKMFAKGNSAEKKQVVEAPKIVGLGQGSKTLEDFVKDAVVEVIGRDIAKKWNDGADYHAMAEAEIKRQIKEWINDNLPVMIERIVKEEIARVIEKVGS